MTAEPELLPRTSVHHHQVKYFECDQQGVVFNAWYLAWFDEAFGTFLADGGLSYRDLVSSGTDVQVVHSEMDWRGSLRWGEEADVEVRLERIGTTSFTLGFRVLRDDGGVVLTGRTVYVTVRVGSGGPGPAGVAGATAGKVPVPPHVAAALGPARAARRPARRPPAPG